MIISRTVKDTDGLTGVANVHFIIMKNNPVLGSEQEEDSDHRQSF